MPQKRVPAVGKGKKMVKMVKMVVPRALPFEANQNVRSNRAALFGRCLHTQLDPEMQSTQLKIQSCQGSEITKSW